MSNEGPAFCDIRLPDLDTGDGISARSVEALVTIRPNPEDFPCEWVAMAGGEVIWRDKDLAAAYSRLREAGYRFLRYEGECAEVWEREG